MQERGARTTSPPVYGEVAPYTTDQPHIRRIIIPYFSSLVQRRWELAKGYFEFCGVGMIRARLMSVVYGLEVETHPYRAFLLPYRQRFGTGWDFFVILFPP